jgi:predicted nucleic acid-binding protein
MILLDVNVLINAFRQDTPQHSLCRHWLADIASADARFGLSPLVLSDFIRITTNPRVFRAPRYARLTSERRLVGGPGDRMGLRVDHIRS